MRPRPLVFAGLAVAVGAGTVAAFAGTGGSELTAERPATGPQASGPRVVLRCADRAEPGPRGFTFRRDVVRGAFALIAVRGIGRRPRGSFEPRDGRLSGTKFPVAVRAGHGAEVRIAPKDAHAAALLVGDTRAADSVADGAPAARYAPCAADTPRFSGGGTVGPITGWAGALVVTGPRCVTLHVTVDGRRRRNVELPLGADCR